MSDRLDGVIHSGEVTPLDWLGPRRGISYLRFSNHVARARREVLREYPPESSIRAVAVLPLSVDASFVDSELSLVRLPPWGEFFFPDGPIVIWQLPYEIMPDRANYYRQIKAVIRHEFEHGLEMDHPQPGLIQRDHIRRSPEQPASPLEWQA